jgi:hypothetical protein
MDTTVAPHDVMLVCRHGHVITDRLGACPDRLPAHCDRCGADTFTCCLTCGHPLPGAFQLPGPVPIGTAPPPQFCSRCGATFPWSAAPRPATAATPLAQLEALLRRVPVVVRHLRSRHGDRPPFTVRDDFDLEDLLRALLAVPFDSFSLESRTPRYAIGTRTDFRIERGRIALTTKRAPSGLNERQFAVQLAEDVAYYQARRDCRTLVAFLHDPEMLLREPSRLEAAWSKLHDELDVRCVIA